MLKITKTDKVELQKVQQPVEFKKLVFDYQSMWYTNRALNARSQTYNRYLDNVVVYWIANVPWIWATDDFTPTSNSTDIPMTTIFNKTGDLKWEIDGDWGILIPEDWTYLITIEHVFLMYPTISDWDVKAAYWLYPIIPLLYETTSWFSSLDSRLFFTRQATTSFSFTASASKWDPLYAAATHRRTWQTFPVQAVFFITKLS